MVINEGKAYGLPIVAFNMPYSAPYQKGVILIEMFNVSIKVQLTNIFWASSDCII